MTAQFTICNKSWHYHWISYHIKSTLLPLLCQPFSKQTWFSWFPLDCIPALVQELNHWQGPFTGQTSFLLANQQCYSTSVIALTESQITDHSQGSSLTGLLISSSTSELLMEGLSIVLSYLFILFTLLCIRCFDTVSAPGRASDLQKTE